MGRSSLGQRGALITCHRITNKQTSSFICLCMIHDQDLFDDGMYKNMTPFLVAVLRQNVQLVKSVMNKFPSRSDLFGTLFCPIKAQMPEIGDDQKPTRRMIRVTALTAAARTGDIEMVCLLLDCGAVLKELTCIADLIERAEASGDCDDPALVVS